MKTSIREEIHRLRRGIQRAWHKEGRRTFFVSLPIHFRFVPLGGDGRVDQPGLGKMRAMKAVLPARVLDELSSIDECHVKGMRHLFRERKKESKRCVSSRYVGSPSRPAKMAYGSDSHLRFCARRDWSEANSCPVLACLPPLTLSPSPLPPDPTTHPSR
jgi:hypothetical protein